MLISRRSSAPLRAAPIRLVATATAVGPSSRARVAKAVLGAGGLAAAMVLTGCGGDDDGTDAAASSNPACTPAPTPAPTLSGAVAAFDLSSVAQVTRVYEDNGFFVVNALSTGKITDLATTFFGIVEDAGFAVAGSDDEGFEAEVFFSSGQVAAGQIVLTESDCPGVVDVKLSLLDDPAVVSGATTSEAPEPTTS